MLRPTDSLRHLRHIRVISVLELLESAISLYLHKNWVLAASCARCALVAGRWLLAACLHADASSKKMSREWRERCTM